MVFWSYSPAIKALAVQMLLDGRLQSHICQTLGRSISRQSFDQWLDLYQQTQLVICDPAAYETCGRPTMLTPEDCTFMVELVRSEPGLFLEEIRERLYDSTGTLLSFQAVHDNLVNKLSITLKKPSTANCRKDLVAKWAFVEQMDFFPAEFLVFVGKLRGSVSLFLCIES
jgi:transposase